jgi:hypothetical protein
MSHITSATTATAMPTDHDLPPLPPVQPGLYRHYKGGEYHLLDVVRHSETLEPLVLYRALYGERGLWVRPAAMFSEDVVIGGVTQPRFAWVAHVTQEDGHVG